MPTSSWYQGSLPGTSYTPQSNYTVNQQNPWAGQAAHDPIGSWGSQAPGTVNQPSDMIGGYDQNQAARYGTPAAQPQQNPWATQSPTYGGGSSYIPMQDFSGGSGSNMLNGYLSQVMGGRPSGQLDKYMDILNQQAVRNMGNATAQAMSKAGAQGAGLGSQAVMLAGQAANQAQLNQSQIAAQAAMEEALQAPRMALGMAQLNQSAAAQAAQAAAQREQLGLNRQEAWQTAQNQNTQNLLQMGSMQQQMEQAQLAGLQQEWQRQQNAWMMPWQMMIAPQSGAYGSGGGGGNPWAMMGGTMIGAGADYVGNNWPEIKNTVSQWWNNMGSNPTAYGWGGTEQGF